MTPTRPVSQQVTVYLPDEQGASEPLALLLPPTPDFSNTSLHQAILQQFRYWGIRRTLDTYRRAVESNVDVLGAISKFYEAQEAVERGRIRWENRYILRDIEIKRMQTELLEEEKKRITALTDINDLQVNLALSEDRLSQVDEIAEERRLRRESEKLDAAAERERKQAEVTEAKRLRELAEERLKGISDDKKIGKINRAVDQAEAMTRKEKADQKLADVTSGMGGASFGDQMKKMNQARKDFETLQMIKQKDIKKYGGEDKIPEYLQVIYGKMEDALVDGGAER